MATRRTAWACGLLAGVLGACGASEDDVTDGSRDGRDNGGGDTGCTAGRCDDTIWIPCTGGHWGTGVSCAESGRYCVESLGGCMPCFPDHTRCEGNDVMQCGADGTTETLVRTCDPAAGEACDPASGVCINPCASAAAARSNIGCEYWAVDLDNAESNMDSAASGQFAVVVVNLSNLYSSDVLVERDEGFYGAEHNLVDVERATVYPGDLQIFRLPRWDVDGEGAPDTDDDPQTGLSRRVFHITSSTPVVAYQFNTLNQVYSNAASVLIPTSALGTDYWAIISGPSNPTRLFPGLAPNRDYLTVVGVADGTTVWVTPTSKIMAGVGQASTGIGPVAEIAAGARTEFALDRFDVLNLETDSVARLTDPYPDLTGSHIESTGPIVAFVGVDLAVIGNDVLPGDPTPEDPDNCCAEHMESQLTPTSALGTKFVVSRSVVRASNPANPYWGMEYDYYRVLAVRDETTVTTSLGDIGSFTLNAGEYHEFKSRDGFILTASGPGPADQRPVIVAQFIVSQEQVYEPRASAGGDSDMVYIPPVEQRRGTYIFTTGEGFSENWAVVSMPEGASATIDGGDVATTCHPTYTDGTLDGLLYRAYHCQIQDGRHEVIATGAQPVGVMVFGYYGVGSYQYPAGSDYNVIFFG